MDFISALEVGLKAAKTAEVAQQEIKDVLLELDRQVREVSEGRVGIKLTQRKTDDGAIAYVSAIFGKPPETYQAIVAYSLVIPNNPEQEIARWSQDPAGYPCKIKWGETEYSCEDLKALENHLAELLQDPIVATNISTLMRKTPEPNQ
jgi:hypothetical protein